MLRSRSLALGALLVCAVACGDGGGSGTAGSAGTSGSGATGGLASDAGGTGAVDFFTGGTGAVGPGDGGTGGVGGGTGGDSTSVLPAYTCPSEGGAPPSPITSGQAPTLAVATAVGGDATDLLASSVALADGSAALLVIASSPGRTLNTAATSEESCVLYRVSVEGNVTRVATWPHELGAAALVAGDAAGNLVVAGVAHAAFAVGGLPVDSNGDGDGFVYLLDMSTSGDVSAGPSFPFTGDLSLGSLLEAPDGSLAFAGSLTGRLDVGAEAIEPPAFDSGPLQAAFVARLGARRTLAWQRVFHATGMHNDPQALDGTGGTDGFGHSSVTDLALTPDDALVVGTVFEGGIDLDDLRFPNDGYTDGLVLKLDQDGSSVWAQHLYGILGAKYVQVIGPEGSGGVSGNAPRDGEVSDLRVDVDADGRVAVTASLVGHALVSGVDLDGSTSGHLTALFAADGALLGALPDGGTDVTFEAGGDIAAWNGSSLFQPALSGSTSWSLAPGGQLLGTKASRLENGPQGLWVTGSFLGSVDLGAGPLASSGCADAFAARFTAAP